jgi:hypothetical protein
MPQLSRILFFRRRFDNNDIVFLGPRRFCRLDFGSGGACGGDALGTGRKTPRSFN